MTCLRHMKETHMPSKSRLTKTVSPVLLVLALIATALSLSAGAAGAQVDADTGYCDEISSNQLYWSIDDVKRVQVRSSLGWIATVTAPQDSFSVETRRASGSYFLRAKLNSGEVVDIACTKRPYLGFDVTATADPICTIREFPLGTYLSVANTDGSLNLRDENGWVANIDKTEPYRGSVEFKDSYFIANRNPVQGRIDIPCILEAPVNARQIWGGVKDGLTPGLAATNGDYEVVELNRVDDAYLIRNTKTGETRSINAGSDWLPQLISADGTIVSVLDSDSGDRYEVHLDTAPGQLTYYLID